MNVQESYKVLRVDPGADMDEVKASFRKLAFKLHPDLNPSPDAQQQFQRLNEAYVLLKTTLEQEGPAAGAGRGRTGRKRGGQRGEERGAADRKARTREERRTEKPGSASTGPGRKKFFYKKEEVLKDILSDPFARQVYEDIYQRVRRDRPGQAPPKQSVQRNLTVNMGRRSLNFDLSRGPLTRIRKWFTGQLDDEQSVAFPAHHLIPGRTLRLEIGSRFGKSRTVEVRLPADFQLGKPLRLRGLGRKLGPFTGDLFLNITVK